MAAPARRPCEPWEPIWCGVDVASGGPVGYTPAAVAEMTAVATDILWALSGRRYGVCATTIRPCKRSCSDVDDWWPWLGGPPPVTGPPALWPTWYPFFDVCRCGRDDCSCVTVEEVDVGFPVNELTEVTVDAVTYDNGGVNPPVSTIARVDDWHRVVRVDGAAWPTCQDLTAATGGDGTWSLTFTYGHPVPPAGRLAVGVLAGELLKMCSGENCDLPMTVQSVTRTGITYQMLDPGLFLDKGRTGIYLVDLFLLAVNPNRSKRRPGVWRADDRRFRARRVDT